MRRRGTFGDFSETILNFFDEASLKNFIEPWEDFISLECSVANTCEFNRLIIVGLWARCRSSEC